MPLSGPSGLLLKGHTNAIGHTIQGYIHDLTPTNQLVDILPLMDSPRSTRMHAVSRSGVVARLLSFIAGVERRIRRTRLLPIQHNTAD